MLDALLILAVLTITLFAYLSSSKSKSNSKLKRPPGPWSIPILGHLPLLGDQPARTLLEWKKIYGPIISVTFGSFPAVVLNDANSIKAAFNLSAFSGRPNIKLLNDYSRGRKGFMFSDGPHSQEQRQFTKRNLKDFGYGTRTMESIIGDQTTQLVKRLEVSVNTNVEVIRLFNGYTINSLWGIVSGDPLDPADKTTTELARCISRCASFPGFLDKLMIFIPRLAVWLPNLTGYNERMTCISMVQGFLDKQLMLSKASRIPNEPSHVMGAYLDKVEETMDPQSSFHETKNSATIAMQDLFAAGVETTSTTMEWTFYYLAKFPEVQRKLQTQIDKVIGQSRLPSATDKLQMPYAEAVTNEVLRIATILPLSLYHSTMEDVEFNGYFIPKDTVILGNLHAAHNDPEVWGDPQIFRPERFLDENGNILKIGAFIPFSWGKRNCIGENLARLQLFLFTVSIFQRFEICASGRLPSSLGHFGMTVGPYDFDVTVKNRSYK